MSNWDKLAAESRRPDYQLTDDIVIPQPTGAAIKKLRESINIEDDLRVLLGERYDELEPMIFGESVLFPSALRDSMIKHFGIDGPESAASSS